MTDDLTSCKDGARDAADKAMERGDIRKRRLARRPGSETTCEDWDGRRPAHLRAVSFHAFCAWSSDRIASRFAMMNDRTSSESLRGSVRNRPRRP